jgi:hypothetical protein
MRAEFLKIALTTLIVFSFCTSEDLSFAPLSRHNTALFFLSHFQVLSRFPILVAVFAGVATFFHQPLSISTFLLVISSFFHLLHSSIFENLGIYMK